MMEYVGVGITGSSKPKGVKLKMRGCKVRSGVYWQGALKQKDIKQVGCKTAATCTNTQRIFQFLSGGWRD
jgi:hypothetical protein